MNLIDVKNLLFKYKMYSGEKEEVIEHTAIDNISLSIKKGDFVGILGHNGSGKSTLAKIIMGILKPDSGSIFFDGKDITNIGITDRAKLGIGFAFQQPVKFKGLTVRDLIELSSGNTIHVSEACNYLSDVGLCAKDYLNREVSNSLSGGELKRIEIAMLAAKKSKLTVFDEPEAGIDLWSFNSLISVFEKMHSEISDSSIVIISHQEKILNIADEIILLVDGKVQAVGQKEEVLPLLLNNTQKPCKVMLEKGGN